MRIYHLRCHFCMGFYVCVWLKLHAEQLAVGANQMNTTSIPTYTLTHSYAERTLAYLHDSGKRSECLMQISYYVIKPVARQMLNRKQTPVFSLPNITKKSKTKKCEDARQKYFQHAVRTVPSYRSRFQ